MRTGKAETTTPIKIAQENGVKSRPTRRFLILPRCCAQGWVSAPQTSFIRQETQHLSVRFECFEQGTQIPPPPRMLPQGAVT